MNLVSYGIYIIIFNHLFLATFSGEDDCLSITALCGSMDARDPRYAAIIRVQAGRYEIIADLANMVKDLLKTFYQACGKNFILPRRCFRRSV
jgi:hypothetical protein